MMVLVDTSIWIDHLRESSKGLVELLQQENVICHPFIIGELACGNLKNQKMILELLENLPQAQLVDDSEVRKFIEMRKLMGQGIGWIDMHLISSALISDTALWTSDKRLRIVAQKLKVLWK
jgi:predicted nucleic acid-binding protein